MRLLLILPFLLSSIAGCQLINRSIIHNDTNSPLVVELKTERRDLGWELQDRKKLKVPPLSVCKLDYDIFHQSQIKVTEESSRESVSRIGLLSKESVLYTVVSDEQSKYIVQHVAPGSLRDKIYDSKEDCIEINEGLLDDILYFRKH